MEDILAADIPADATARSSLEVTAEADQPFDTTAIVNGTTYHLAGRFKRSADERQISAEIDYSESAGEQAKSIVQIKSKIIVRVGKPTSLGGTLSPNNGRSSALILTLRRF